MSNRPQHLDDIFAEWPYEFGQASARLLRGADGRDLVQLRVDLGVLQMEASGRPDGTRPGGCDTYYDHLMSLAFQEGEAFELDDNRCLQIDREFMQFFHRRIAWLALRAFGRAISDADHTLALMDFSSSHAPDTEWAEMHEQYRPFVLFHRAQASALVELERKQPAAAVAAIDEGVNKIRDVFAAHDAEEEFEDSQLALKLHELKQAIADHFELRPTLAQQLADAIAAEQYELAARLRDKLGRQRRKR
ncbi:MAG: UvrB/UvrC motif-containing protein [Pirellulales bacterium]